MTARKPLRPSAGLATVRYEIRGKLARRAQLDAQAAARPDLQVVAAAAGQRPR